MDARQFLKEARELYATEKERLMGLQDECDIVSVWGADDFSLDAFKRTMCHFRDRSGFVTTYLHSLLNCKPISELIVDSDALKGPWVEEQKAIPKRAKAESGSQFGRMMALWEIYTLELVLKYFDEIVKRLKQRVAENNAIGELNKALRKYPKASCGGAMGTKVSESISMYKEISGAEADIERYKQMIEIGSKLVTDNDELMKMMNNSMNARSTRIKQLTKEHGNAESNIRDTLLDAMKGKFIYWDEGKSKSSRYMCLTDVKVDGWSDKDVYLKGPSIYFERGVIPKLSPDCSVFLSSMSTLDATVDCLHVVEIDDLLKEVEKHTPFMLDYMKKLTENMASK